jgi:hypothetical protein
MTANEPAHPVDISLLRAQAVMQVAQALPHLAQDARGLRRGGGRKTAGFGGRMKYCLCKQYPV